jgi:hypothetical protein
MPKVLDEFYWHGIEMSSEIPTSEKSDGFNVYWRAHYASKGFSAADKRAARKEYNRGWRAYKTGNWKPQSLFPIWPLVLVGGLGIYWYLNRDKKSATGLGQGPSWDTVTRSSSTQAGQVAQSTNLFGHGVRGPMWHTWWPYPGEGDNLTDPDLVASMMGEDGLGAVSSVKDIKTLHDVGSYATSRLAYAKKNCPSYVAGQYGAVLNDLNKYMTTTYKNIKPSGGSTVGVKGFAARLATADHLCEIANVPKTGTENKKTGKAENKKAGKLALFAAAGVAAYLLLR